MMAMAERDLESTNTTWVSTDPGQHMDRQRCSPVPDSGVHSVDQRATTLLSAPLTSKRFLSINHKQVRTGKSTQLIYSSPIKSQRPTLEEMVSPRTPGSETEDLVPSARMWVGIGDVGPKASWVL